MSPASWSLKRPTTCFQKEQFQCYIRRDTGSCCCRLPAPVSFPVVEEAAAAAALIRETLERSRYAAARAAPGSSRPVLMYRCSGDPGRRTSDVRLRAGERGGDWVRKVETSMWEFPCSRCSSEDFMGTCHRPALWVYYGVNTFLST